MILRFFDHLEGAVGLIGVVLRLEDAGISVFCGGDSLLCRSVQDVRRLSRLSAASVLLFESLTN